MKFTEEFRPDGAIDEMEHRLYALAAIDTDAVKKFGKIKDRESDFKEIVAKARERAGYLREFNAKVEPRLKIVSASARCVADNHDGAIDRPLRTNIGSRKRR